MNINGFGGGYGGGGYGGGGYGGGGGFFDLGPSVVSPGLNQLLARHGQSTTGWFGVGRTFRAREAVFDIGEPVAALGKIVDGPGGVLEVQPLEGSLLTEEWMVKQGWDESDRASWRKLTEMHPAVIMTDAPHLVGNLIGRSPTYIQQQVPAFMMQGATQPQGQMQQAPIVGQVISPIQQTAVIGQVLPPQSQEMPQTQTAVYDDTQTHTQTHTFTVPPGAVAGQQVTFQLSDRQVKITIPNLPPGTQFQCEV